MGGKWPIRIFGPDQKAFIRLKAHDDTVIDLSLPRLLILAPYRKRVIKAGKNDREVEIGEALNPSVVGGSRDLVNYEPADAPALLGRDALHQSGWKLFMDPRGENFLELPVQAETPASAAAQAAPAPAAKGPEKASPLVAPKT